MNDSRADSDRGKGWPGFASVRTALCFVFLASYFWSILSPESPGAYLFVAVGVVLLAMSVPAMANFHRVFGALALVAFALTVVVGRFSVEEFVTGLPTYFGIVAVLLILTLAGYPLRAKRYEGQIRAVISALERRGARPKTTAGIMGQVLGSVLDVGSLVLVDVIFSRSNPKERLGALKWAARTFSFVPLWSNLNLLTATAIVLTGTSYLGLLALSLPFTIVGIGVVLFAAQREPSSVNEDSEIACPEPLNRRAAAIFLYPVGLIVAVALVNVVFPEIPLTSSIALTVVVAVLLIALIASAVNRSPSPSKRLVRESRASLASSSPEFALFGTAGVLVVSLQSLGALAPLGDLLGALPVALVPFALAVTVAVGFALGIHVLPMVLLINAAFPLSQTDTPALWALAVILGCQGALLMTPFSASVTMLARITELPHAEVGRKANARFSLTLGACSFVYLGLMTLILHPWV